MSNMARGQYQVHSCRSGLSIDSHTSRSCELEIVDPIMTRINPADRQVQLRRTIEAEIIPRLMLSSPKELTSPQHKEAAIASTIEHEDVLNFTALLLKGGAPELSAFLIDISDRGISQRSILLQLFAPAARQLGWLWETDAVDFAIVTMAMGALQQALRVLDFDPGHNVAREASQQRSIFLAPGFGEQHSFPIQILDIFFRRAGWDVESEPTLDPQRMCRDLRRRHFDVVGLSVSRDSLLDRLASDIQQFRRVSKNKSMIVLVGGRVFVENPELAAKVGADSTADDARSAVLTAESLVPVSIGHCI